MRRERRRWSELSQSVCTESPGKIQFNKIYMYIHIHIYTFYKEMLNKIPISLHRISWESIVDMFWQQRNECYIGNIYKYGFLPFLAKDFRLSLMFNNKICNFSYVNENNQVMKISQHKVVMNRKYFYLKNNNKSEVKGRLSKNRLNTLLPPILEFGHNIIVFFGVWWFGHLVNIRFWDWENAISPLLRKTHNNLRESILLILRKSFRD